MMTLRIILCLLVCVGCSKQPSSDTTAFSGRALTMDYNIIVGAKLSSEQSQDIQALIDATFQEVNDTFSTDWNPKSELSALNRLGAHTKVKLSQPMLEALTITDTIERLTQGRFDPTIGPLKVLWKSQLSQGKKPSEEEIQAAAKSVGWHKIHVEQGMFWKEDADTELDLGGVAKGYAIDMLVDRLAKAGYQNVFVEWGGEIRAIGHHPDNRPWKVYITRLNDIDPSHAIAVVSLENQAIATSGDYVQNWTVRAGDRKISYFHIIDPVTHHPLEITPQSIASASVLASTCALADGLATAAMMFATEDEAKAWFAEVQKQIPNVQFWLFTREN